MSICIIGGGFIGINYAIRESKKSKVYLLSKKKKSLKNILTFKLNYSKKSFFNFFKNKRIKKIFFFQEFHIQIFVKSMLKVFIILKQKFW